MLHNTAQGPARYTPLPLPSDLQLWSIWANQWWHAYACQYWLAQMAAVNIGTFLMVYVIAIICNAHYRTHKR